MLAGEGRLSSKAVGTHTYQSQTLPAVEVGTVANVVAIVVISVHGNYNYSYNNCYSTTSTTARV